MAMIMMPEQLSLHAPHAGPQHQTTCHACVTSDHTLSRMREASPHHLGDVPHLQSLDRVETGHITSQETKERCCLGECESVSHVPGMLLLLSQ